MTKKAQAMKIGLLTPYNGGNLGDGAIQEAVIAGIRARYPEACLHGLTLDPAKTRQLHAIPCSPLTALSLPHYGMAVAPQPSAVGESPEPGAAPAHRLREFIKGIGPLFRLAKLAQRLVGVARCLPAEARFIREGYRLFKGFDMLVVAGGGQLDDYWGGPWGHPYTLLKWGLIARAAGARYVFLSVGTCTLESPLSVLFVKWALRLACYRSYRDQHSKQLLERFTFTCDDPVVPDLAFSRDVPAAAPRQGGGRPVVAVSPIAYLSSHSWPKKELGTYAPYLAALTEFVGGLLRNGNAVILYYTDTTDRIVVSEMMAALREQVPETCGSLESQTIGSVEALLTLMTRVDCVVASRLHGVILAHLAGRPVLAVSYDRKVTTHMENLGQSAYCLDIHTVDTAALAAGFDRLCRDQQEVRVAVAGEIARYRSALGSQYDQVLAGQAGAECQRTPEVSGVQL
jgi:polysaccharide pyruvyl transferase WcaK-like protein